MTQLLTVFSGVSFLLFGIGYLLWPPFRQDLYRYGVGHLRIFIALLQLAGAMAELIGLAIPQLGCLAAAGLAMMMLVAVILRIHIRDSFPKSLPAVFYLLLNVYLFVALIRR